MNKLVKLVFAASAVVTLTAQAQQMTDIQTSAPAPGYLQDSRNVVTRSAYDLCWHTASWTPADAVPGCDGELVKTVAVPAPAPAPVPPAPPAPAPTAQKVSYAADAFFDFDKAVLKPGGKQKLDELVSNLSAINLEVIIAVGHTDSVGSVAYNQKLSVRRAEAVKAYLVSKGIESNRVYTEGKGKAQPVADNKSAAGRAKNRRVEIEVVGTKK